MSVPKKSPRLRLVDGESDSSGEDSNAKPRFRVVGLRELSRSEQELVRRVVAQIAPSAAIIGVGLTPRSWDLRPVVAHPNQNGPSIIRLLGPEVTLSVSASNRMHDLLQRLSAFDDVSGKLVDWGVLDGQVWYRREVVDRTLADIFGKAVKLNLTNGLSFGKRLVQRVAAWHDHGIVHGHITPSNISVSETGEVTLLDAGVALAAVHSSYALSHEKFPKGYSQESFAPEALKGGSPILATDVYGAGLVLRRVFSEVREQLELPEGAGESEAQHSDSTFQVLLDLFGAMVDAEPKRRPTLQEVKSVLEHHLPTYSRSVRKQNATPSELPKKSQKSVMLRPGMSQQKEMKERSSGKQSVKKNATRKDAANKDVANAPQEGTSKQSPPEFASESYKQKAEKPREENRLKSETPELKPNNDFFESAFSELKRGEPRREEETKKSQLDFSLSSPTPKSFPIPFLVGGLLLLLAFFVFRSFEGESPSQYSNDELQFAWYSQAPSMMVPVAESALDPENPNPFAEMLIIKSAMNGEIRNSGVNVQLLQIAFDKQWEMELRPADRRVALALALSGLLQSVPEDLPSLEILHPGVLLAIAASSGESVGRVLQDISARTLIKLPPPYGPAFHILTQKYPDATCGDKEVRFLAQLGTLGIDDAELLFAFLEQETDIKLRAIANLFSQDNASAREFLKIVLRHPNARIKHSGVAWATRFDLLSWRGVSPVDKLFLLAGMFPEKEIGRDEVITLFAHPSSKIRGRAMGEALNRVQFGHPGASALLKMLRGRPEILGAKQTALLVSFLAAPEKVKPSRIQSWLESSPPRPLIELLLLTTTKNSEATPLDFELSRHLREGGWNPSIEILEKLAAHPDNATRFFSYAKLFEHPDAKRAFAILLSARDKETEPQFRTRLGLMLDNIRGIR